MKTQGLQDRTSEVKENAGEKGGAGKRFASSCVGEQLPPCPAARAMLLHQGTSAFTGPRVLSSACVSRTTVCCPELCRTYAASLSPLPPPPLSMPIDADKFLAAKDTQLTAVDSPCWDLPPSRIFALACPSALVLLSFTPSGIFLHMPGLNSNVTPMHFAYVFSPMSRVVATMPGSGDK